jgi:hypothetical protein
MPTKYFFQVDNGIVTGSFSASRDDWSAVVIPSRLREVDAAVFASVPLLSACDKNGVFTPPPPVVRDESTSRLSKQDITTQLHALLNAL